MKQAILILALCLSLAVPTLSSAADPVPAKATKPAKSPVDPAKEAEHTKEDVKRHRTIAAAHEAAAKCQESGKAESLCMAELAKACKGIAYGKFCGMKHELGRASSALG